MTEGKLPNRRKTPWINIATLIALIGVLITVAMAASQVTTAFKDLESTVNNLEEKIDDLETRLDSVEEGQLGKEEAKEIAITSAETVYEKLDTEAKQEAAEQVLQTLIENEVLSVNQIKSYLSSKPAGRTDLLNGVTNEVVYASLVETYGELAKNAKIALDH